ncbi:MAG: hypothetical protein ACHBN1_13055 [Heteroscytonema crispum UTEX LB 1556]
MGFGGRLGATGVGDGCGRQGGRLGEQETTNPTGEPVLGGLPSRSTRFTTNDPSGEPVAWVGKTPLRPLARPQDRSGSPTFEREAIRGESSRLQTQAPLHHQRPFGRTSRLGRENATATLGQTPRPQWLPYL